MRFAIIENQQVSNIAIALEPQANNWVRSETANIGDHYDGKTFTPPVVVPKEGIDTRIAPTAFKRRFTQEERIKIRNLAKENDVVFDFMDLLGDSRPIKVDDVDVVNAITLLEKVGAIGEGRSKEILNPQIEEAERP